MAVDAAGTIYVVDSVLNEILVESQDSEGLVMAGISGPSGYAGTTAATAITCTGSSMSPDGLSGPTAITATIDPATGYNILYVADSVNSRVVKIIVSPGANFGVCTVVGMGGGSVTLNDPLGVAVNEYGDLFISDYTAGPDSHGMIVRIPGYTGGGQTIGVAYDMMDEHTTIEGGAVTTGVWYPARIAWDLYDDELYIADTGNNRILAARERWISGNGGNPWEPSLYFTGDWTPGVNNIPFGISVDSVGNVYFTDGYWKAVYEVPHGTMTAYALNTENWYFSGELEAPNGVYVDQWGSVYVSDTGYGLVITNVGKVTDTDVGTGSVNFYHLPLNVDSMEWQMLMFYVEDGTTVASVSAFTGGSEFLDFTASNYDLGRYYCGGFRANPYLGNYCGVWVGFYPMAPGLRRGSVALYDASGNELANVPVFGFGSAPELEFYPAGYGAAVSTGGAATLGPMQIALDGNSDMFVANSTGNNVVAVPPAGGAAQVIPATGDPSGATPSGPQQADGVALDGAGNVFISDHLGSQIWVANPRNSYNLIPLQIDGLHHTPLVEPMALNFDAAGNLYIADWGNNRVVEVSGIYPSGASGVFAGHGSVVNTGGYSFANSDGTKSVTGVAVDPLENIYITDSVDQAIVEAPQNMNQIDAIGYYNNWSEYPGWPYVYFGSPAAGFSTPQGVASDGMGNIYVVDAGYQIVSAANWNTGYGLIVGSINPISPPIGVNPQTGIANLFGVTVDPQGNVFVPDYANNRIVGFYPTIPPTLNFGSEYVGSTTAYGAPVILANIGNETLTFQVPASGYNPSISANFSLTSGEGACPQIGSGGTAYTLSPATGCYLSVDFAPTVVGAITGSVLLTDDSLYPAGWTDTALAYTPQQVPLTGVGVMDFTVAAANPASAVVNPGGTAITYVEISPLGNATFPDQVNFTSSGAPAGATVAFSPAAIAAGSSATNVSVTITVPSATAANHTQSLGRKLAPISFALLLLPLLGIRRMRKTWQRYLTVLILLVGGLAATTALSGCTSSPSGYFGQGAIYDYNIVVTATSNGVSHSTSVVLTVN
ncbi:MAG: hypothetical protein ABSC47_01250 [Terracidiphilus sp.]